MTAEKRHVVRMLCKALLLISLPLAGFAWALPEDSTVMAAAAGLALLSLLVGFGAEFLASTAENDLSELEAQVAALRARRKEEVEQHGEKLRQLDRIVALLTDQNQTLRANLVAVQVDIQRRREALLKVAGEALTLETLPDAQGSGYGVRAAS